MVRILMLLMIVGAITTPLWAALQTDTHTYILCKNDKVVLAINRQTGLETRICVGTLPRPMVIHGGIGYVVNYWSADVSVIDLQSNTVTQTIPVGKLPQSIAIHGRIGYVVNYWSADVSVIDLQSNTVTQTIPVGKEPISMVIHGGMGYVVNEKTNNVSVLDLSTNEVIQTIDVGKRPKSIVIHGGMGYVVNEKTNNVSVLDLQINAVTQTIPVGQRPKSIVIHGGMGYVVNYESSTISIIDLKTNTVTQNIPVGKFPQSIAIHGGMGYVVNHESSTISIIDLKTNTVTQTIPVGKFPQSIAIHGDIGYVMDGESGDVSVIDLQTNRVITTLKTNYHSTIDFSDTHVYLGLKKARPLYPTLATLKIAKAQKALGDFVAMMPEVFKLGEIEPRLLPKEKNAFDTLPAYLLAQNIFWDVDTDKPLMDPQDILATLVTMKYPQKFLKTEAGAWLRKRLHMAFFQTVWLGDKDKAKKMLTYFMQLQDPVIRKLATYHFKMGAKEDGSFKDALDE